MKNSLIDSAKRIVSPILGPLLGLLLSLLLGLSLLVSSTSAHAEVVNINSQQLKQLVADGAALIDIRLAEEWADTGVVAGSHTLTFFDEKGGYDAKKWLTETRQIANTNPIVLICHTGTRSKIVADWLSKGVGINPVYNVSRGIDQWIKQGNPVEAK